MLGGRRKKDYDAEAAAHNLEQQAAALGLTDEPGSDGEAFPAVPVVSAEDPIPEGADEEEAA